MVDRIEIIDYLIAQADKLADELTDMEDPKYLHSITQDELDNFWIMEHHMRALFEAAHALKRIQSS